MIPSSVIFKFEDDMSREQRPHKWEKEICAWAGGIPVEWREVGQEEWKLIGPNCKLPDWSDPLLEFRIYDRHREVKEAMKRGEKCEYRFGDTWFEATGALSDYSGCWDDREWRIAPKPDPYQHLRDAIRAGKQIEFYRSFTDSWVSIGTADDHNPDRTFALPPDQYRIAPKPAPKERVVLCELRSVSMDDPSIRKFANVTLNESGEAFKVEFPK